MGGSFRFLQRVWQLVGWWQEDKHEEAFVPDNFDTTPLKKAVAKATKKVSEDLADLGFNTAIAALMECLNDFYDLRYSVLIKQAPEEWHVALNTFVQLLAPFAPHIAEELWRELGHEGSVHTTKWPAYDPKYLVSDSMTVVVQVNGKVRANIVVPTDSSKDKIIDTAKADEKVKAYIDGKELHKTIYVPGKLVNFVV